MYAVVPKATLRKRCLGIMDLLEKIGGGYLMQLMEMEVLASAKFPPASILYKGAVRRGAEFSTHRHFYSRFVFRWPPATKGSTTVCCASSAHAFRMACPTQSPHSHFSAL
jgi:hypothetical protein